MQTQPDIYKPSKPFWLWSRDSIERVIALFPNASQSWPAGTADDLETVNLNTLCLCLPVRPANAMPERGQESLVIDFAVKTFNSFQE